LLSISRSRQGDGRPDKFAVLVVADAEADRVLHRRMREQYLLDLDRGDVLAAPDDHFLDTAFEIQVALAQHAEITGAEPVAVERLSCRSGIGHVPGHHPGPLD